MCRKPWLPGVILICLLVIVLTGCQQISAGEQPDEPISPAEGVASEELTENGQKAPAETTEKEPDQPDDEEVLELVVQAHSVALDIFFSAFEDGFLGVEPVPYAEVKPVLLQHFSADLVDNEFRQFYEESLWQWGYEMHFAFPFFDRENIIDLAVIKREDTRIVIRGTAYVNYEEYDTTTHYLTYENERWVLN